MRASNLVDRCNDAKMQTCDNCCLPAVLKRPLLMFLPAGQSLSWKLYIFLLSGEVYDSFEAGLPGSDQIYRRWDGDWQDLPPALAFTGIGLITEHKVWAGVFKIVFIALWKKHFLGAAPKLPETAQKPPKLL